MSKQGHCFWGDNESLTGHDQFPLGESRIRTDDRWGQTVIESIGSREAR